MFHCIECEHFRIISQGIKGGKYGKCAWRSSDTIRGGKSKACKNYTFKNSTESETATAAVHEPEYVDTDGLLEYLNERIEELNRIRNLDNGALARAKATARLEEVQEAVKVIKKETPYGE